MEGGLPNSGPTYEFLGMRSEEPLTIDSLNRLLIKEVVLLRWKLESYECSSDEDLTEENLKEQVSKKIQDPAQSSHSSNSLCKFRV